MESKAQDIEALLNEEVVDLWQLREFCLTEGGLVHGTCEPATSRMKSFVPLYFPSPCKLCELTFLLLLLFLLYFALPLAQTPFENAHGQSSWDCMICGQATRH